MTTKTKMLLAALAGSAVTLGLVAGARVLEGRSRQAGPGNAHPAGTSSTTDRSRQEPDYSAPSGPTGRRDLDESFRRKLLAQENVPTFFDNFVQAALDVRADPGAGPAVRREADLVSGLFEQLLESRHNRFVSYEERARDVCPLTGTRQTLLPQDFAMSQGTHSLMKWKQHDVFKSTFDLVLYWMIMDEIQPDVIVELGSGPGGSAIWFADMASALGFETHVYSYDIHKPDITYPNVTFVEYDLMEISTRPLPFQDRFVGTKLISEDAHVNVTDVLLGMDSFLTAGDYLIVEDSSGKHRDLARFLASANRTYRLDRYYLDFFGVNGSSCRDSIFKVF